MAEHEQKKEEQKKEMEEEEKADCSCQHMIESLVYECITCSKVLCQHTLNQHKDHSVRFDGWYLSTHNLGSNWLPIFEPPNKLYLYVRERRSLFTINVDHVSDYRIPCVVVNQVLYLVGGRVGGEVLGKTSQLLPSSNQKVISLPCASLKVPRYRHAAVAAQSSVLVIGGLSMVEPLTSCELYYPQQGLWKPGASMQFSRVEPSPCVYPNCDHINSVWVFDGIFGQEAEAHDVVERYDYWHNTWATCKIFKPAFDISRFTGVGSHPGNPWLNVILFGGQNEAGPLQHTLSLSYKFANQETGRPQHYRLKIHEPANVSENFCNCQKDGIYAGKYDPSKDAHQLYEWTNTLVKLPDFAKCSLQQSGPSKVEAALCCLTLEPRGSSLHLCTPADRRYTWSKLISITSCSAGVCIAKDHIYVSGGYKYDIGMDVVLDYVIDEAFELSGQFRRSLNHSRGGHAMVALGERWLYVVGGTNEDLTLTLCEKYLLLLYFCCSFYLDP